jgi:hypothetical protein
MTEVEPFSGAGEQAEAAAVEGPSVAPTSCAEPPLEVAVLLCANLIPERLLITPKTWFPKPRQPLTPS